MRPLKLALSAELWYCGALSTLAEARRHVRRQPSPDRGYNETIQDAQNGFKWHDHHLYRPHQHFTYDPSNWSRSLAEKEKAKRKLSLVERLRMEAERAAEAATNKESLAHHQLAALAAMGAEYETTTREAPEAVEATAGAVDAWATVPLQELLDEVQRLQRVLRAPRYRGNASLVIRGRQAQECDAVLVQLLRRLQCAVAGETVTLDALIFSWFVLLDSVTDLLRALTAEGQRTAESEAIRAVFAAFSATLLPHLMDGEWLAGGASLESVVEAAAVLLHPFTMQCAEAAVGPSAVGQLEEAAAHLADSLQRLLVAQLTDPTAGGGGDNDDNGATATVGLREVMDPAHTRALARVTAELCALLGDGDAGCRGLPSLTAHAVRRGSAYLTTLLQTSTAPSGRHELRASLAGGRRHRSRLEAAAAAEAGGEALAVEKGHPKPLALDVAAPPRGIIEPLTEADDVRDTVEAMTSLLRIGGPTAGGGGMAGAMDAALALLAHAPNYDLDANDTARFTVAVMESGLLAAPSHCGLRVGGAEAEADRRAIRLMLLLSRLDVPQVRNRSHLPALLTNVCLQLSPGPDGGQTEETLDAEARNALREWRRLRGVVLRRLFDSVTAAELAAAPGAVHWEQVVAFGEYDGLVPLPLWREACLTRLGPAGLFAGSGSVRRPAELSPRTAEALVALRGRCCLQPRQSRQAPLDSSTLWYLAQLVEVLSGRQLIASELLANPSHWEQAGTFLGYGGAQDAQAAEALFAEARRFVADHRAASNKVHAF